MLGYRRGSWPNINPTLPIYFLLFRAFSSDNSITHRRSWLSGENGPGWIGGSDLIIGPTIWQTRWRTAADNTQLIHLLSPKQFVRRSIFRSPSWLGFVVSEVTLEKYVWGLWWVSEALRGSSGHTNEDLGEYIYMGPIIYNSWLNV